MWIHAQYTLGGCIWYIMINSKQCKWSNRKPCRQHEFLSWAKGKNVWWLLVFFSLATRTFHTHSYVFINILDNSCELHTAADDGTAVGGMYNFWVVGKLSATDCHEYLMAYTRICVASTRGHKQRIAGEEDAVENLFDGKFSSRYFPPSQTQNTY